MSAELKFLKGFRVLKIATATGTPNSLDMLHYTSRPATAIREDLSRPTLGEALDEILPEYFEAGSSDNSNIGETASVSAAGTGPSDSQQPQVIVSIGSIISSQPKPLCLSHFILVWL